MPDDAEHERLERTYAAYRADPRRARAWSAANPGNAAIRAELARAAAGVLASVPGGTILDAGCGTGWWLEQLVADGIPARRLAGAELLQERASAARARIPGARIVRADLRALPFDAGSVSLVALFTVLSSMGSAADVAAALAECRRVLAPGGAVVIWEPRVPTANRGTRLIRAGELRAGLGPRLQLRSITLAPPLARRAGRAYPLLAALPPLRSHRLAVARP